MSSQSYYQIEKWKLKEESVSDTISIVEVDGEAVNGFGAVLKRTPAFILRKEFGQWVITDSYNFFVFDKLPPEFSSKSDKEKSGLLKELREKLTIEDWSWKRSDYGQSVEGEGTILNNSQLPVDFVKLEIRYYSKDGDLVNTDENYAVSQELPPGGRRQFTWYTSNCNRCSSAKVALKFD